MATAIGDLVVRINVDKKRFDLGIGGVEKGLRKMTDTVFNWQKAFVTGGAKAAAAIGAVGVAIAGINVRRQLNEIESLSYFSSRLGMSAGSLAELQHAASLVNIEVPTLNMALQRMTRRVAEAAAGTGEAQLAIKALGLNAKDLARLSPDQQFLEIAQRISEVANQGERVQLAFKLFDSEGVAVVTMMNQGRKGLEDMGQEARDLGLSLSSIDAAKVAEANTELVRAGAAMKGAWRILTIELTPAVLALARAATQMARDLAAQVGGPVKQRRVDTLAQQIEEQRLGRRLREGEAISWESFVAAKKAIEGFDKAASLIARDITGELDSGIQAANAYAKAIADQMESTKAAAEAQRELAAAQREAEQFARQQAQMRMRPIEGAASMIESLFEKVQQSRFGPMTTPQEQRAFQIQQLADKGVPKIQLAALDSLNEELGRFERQQKRIDLAKTIRDQFMNPFDAFIERVRQIRGVEEQLPAGVADRAIAAAREQFLGAQKDFQFQLPSAAEKGSVEAYSTIVQAGKGQEKTAKEQLNITRQQLDQLKTLNVKLGMQQTVSIPRG
ncbi:hypothetical protein [Petrachloros mirabilis]